LHLETFEIILPMGHGCAGCFAAAQCNQDWSQL
jgi:hypothetical protein